MDSLEFKYVYHTHTHTLTTFLLTLRRMGGSMSPVMEMDIGGGGGGGGGESWQEEEGERGGDVDELELVYDSQLNCFYDPFTSKYYELIQ